MRVAFFDETGGSSKPNFSEWRRVARVAGVQLALALGA
jgi:hypothetical protein